MAWVVCKGSGWSCCNSQGLVSWTLTLKPCEGILGALVYLNVLHLCNTMS